MIKKYLPIVLVFVIVFITSAVGNAAEKRLGAPAGVRMVQVESDGLVLEMTAPSYQIEQASLEGIDYDRVVVPGAAHAEVPGEPQVPLVSVLIGVPPEAEIRLEILRDQNARIPGRYRLPPAPVQVRQDGERSLIGGVYRPDRRVYDSEAPYPAAAVFLAEEGWLRDQRVVRLVFAPIQYNPVRESLVWHRDLRVRLRFVGEVGLLQDNDRDVPEEGGSNRLSTHPFESLLANRLLNYQQARAFRSLEAAPVSSPVLAAEFPSPGYRIAVEQDGLYRISYQELTDAGMDLGMVDPQYFHLTNQGQPVAIHVQDGADGSFDPGDTITFFGERFRGDRLAQLYNGEDSDWLDRFIYSGDGRVVFWDPQLDASMFEKYTAENVYWLSMESTPGLRMATVDGAPGGAEVPDHFWKTAHREESRIYWSWHFTGIDTWLWDLIQTTSVSTGTYTATLTALATGAPTATVRGEAVAYTYNHTAYPDHHTQVFLNDETVPVVDATWDGHVRYHFDAQVPLSSLVAGENQLHFVALDTESMVADSLYFDWFEIEYPRAFQAATDQLDFTTSLSGTYRYQIGGFSDPGVEIYDLTFPLTPTRVLSTTVTPAGTGAYTVTFQSSHDTGDRFLVAAVGAPGVVKSPLSITPYTPPDFGASPGADYIIITHSDFLTAAQRLADYRASQGYTSMVVDVAALYDAFNYGIYHPIAVKNFLRYALENWEIAPAYAVLVGSGHWDLHGYQATTDRAVYMPPFLAFVDPWQGEVDSANQIANLVGAEGDPLPDLAIGRIPVESAAELDLVVDKIIAYEAAASRDWQRNILVVADNTPDPAGDFVASSERIIQDHLPAGYRPLRIYQDDYGCTTSSAPGCDAVRNDITTTLNITGALLVNFTGHGAIGRWSHEQVLSTKPAELLTWDNGDRLPIVLDMTCLTGYWIYPRSSSPSLAVELLTLENAGAVATFSPTGLGVAQGHDVLNSGFYDALFRDGIRTVGWAAVGAKLDVFQSGAHFDLIQTYTVFGDPALRVPITHFTYLPAVQR